MEKKIKNQIWKSTRFVVNKKGELICLMLNRINFHVEDALWFEHYVNEERNKKK